MKDYCVNRVKRIMDNKNVFVCRSCGLSHEHYRKANSCCAKQKSRFNKNRAQFVMMYKKEAGVTFKPKPI